MEPQQMGQIKEMRMQLEGTAEIFEKSEEKIRAWWKKTGHQPEADVHTISD